MENEKKRSQNWQIHPSPDTPQSHGDSQHLNSFFLLCIDDSLIKPSISINPSELVALGGEVNIVCTIAYGSAQFYLHKTGDPTPKYSRMGNSSTHTFPITNISLEDKGHYTCSYICSGNSFFISKHSAPLELLVTGKAGPPAISNICFRMAFEAYSFIYLALLVVYVINVKMGICSGELER